MNKEERAAYNIAYCEAHKEETAAYNAAYRKANPLKVAKLCKEWKEIGALRC